MSDLFEKNLEGEKTKNQNEILKKKRHYHAGEFEGPLDLLWQLIRDNKIDIYDIPISEITEQYLEYLDFATQTDLSDLSEFYLMAAKLLRIKSRMMLPVEIDIADDFEDPRDELVDLLIEHQKFKMLSALMEQKEDENEWTFERKNVRRMLPFDENSIWEKIDTWDLLLQMQKMFKNAVSSYSDRTLSTMYEEVTVREKLSLMRDLLQNSGECFFTDLLVRNASELDLVCAFMAILEAVKAHTIEIFQNKMYGDIKILASKRIQNGN